MPPSPLIALAHNRDAQEVVLFCREKPGDEGKRQLHAPGTLETRSSQPLHTHVERDCDDVERHGGISDAAEG